MSLLRTIARRAAASVMVVLFVLTIVFVLSRLSGDPLADLVTDPRITPEVIDEMKKIFGLDKPLLVQYACYIKGLLRGELGFSLYYMKPVEEVLIERFPYTIALLLPAVTVSNILAYKLGVECGWRKGSRFDVLMTSVAVLVRSMPYFWLALLALYVFSVKLGLTPVFGAFSPGTTPSLSLRAVADYLWHYMLPFTVLVFRETLAFALYVRGMTVMVLGEDHVVTAVAKGLPEDVVKNKHVARNALTGIATVLGMRYAFLVDGAVLTETVFSYPGVGRLVFEAVMNRDYWLLQGSVVVLALSVVLVNAITDVLYMVIDPRVKYGGGLGRNEVEAAS